MSRTLQDLRSRRGDIVAELRAINDASKLAKRPFTDDERKRIADLRAEDANLKTEVEATEADDKVRQEIEALQADLNTSAGPRRTTPDEPRPADPTAPKPGFGSLGEQLQAIYSASIHRHRPYDARLKYETWTEHLAPSGASEGAPSDGGFLVQKDFSAELIRRTYEIGSVLSRVRSIPISANSNGLRINAIDETSRVNGSRWGGVQVFWQNEADTPTAKKPKFRQMELNLKKLIGIAYATDELLMDAAALEAVFMEAFSEEMSFTIEDGIFNGTGSGQLLGILNSGALVKVATESGQATKTILKENLDKMWSRAWGRGRLNSVWYINQDIEPQLFSLSQVVGTAGVPVYMPPGGLSASPYATLYGRPVIPVEYMATLGTVGDIVLFDPSQYLMIDKGKMQSASSIHVRFINDETTFRFVYRTDGQPIWYLPLTPKSGSANTLSPYVALASR